MLWQPGRVAVPDTRAYAARARDRLRRRRAPAAGTSYDDVARVRGAVRNAEDLYARRTAATRGRLTRGATSSAGTAGAPTPCPVLVVVTVAALLTTQQAGQGEPDARADRPDTQPQAQRPAVRRRPRRATPLKDDAAGGNVNPKALKAAALPAGPGVHDTGDRHVPRAEGHARRSSARASCTATASRSRTASPASTSPSSSRLSSSTLSDPRSWSGHGVVAQAGRLRARSTSTSR